MGVIIKAKYLPLIERNRINKALDYGFTTELILDVLQRHYPLVDTVEDVHYDTYKRRVGKNNSTFVYGFIITGKQKSGAAFRKHLIYSAHSDGSKKKAYNTMRMLLDLGFNDGLNRIIEPLEFNEKLQALIYEAVDGKNLLQYMSAHARQDEIETILKRAALWIKKFHNFPVPEKTRSAFPVFKFRHLNVGTKKISKNVITADSHQGEKLEAFFKAMDSLLKKLSTSVTPGLVYGDFHPENIITDDPHKNGLTMIDLVDVSYGDQLRDCGSFIQQLHFMGRNFYGENTINNLRKIFLETYFEKSFNELSLSDLQRINAYQAWNALRGFVWFFYTSARREESYGLLEDAWLYLTLAKNKSHGFTISHRSY